MNLPGKGDYIDIHNHGALYSGGKFSVENLMAHEERIPDLQDGLAYSIGIHPWHLNDDNKVKQVERVRTFSGYSNIIAIGEAGFDRLKGASAELQRSAFIDQVEISEEVSKPLFIHCVKAWSELLSEHKSLRPLMPWIIHGFRGKKELALQLISKGMYISFWFDFILRPESAGLIRELPSDRIFLETDGSGVDIGKIYEKVAVDMGLNIIELKRQIYSNFEKLFRH